MKLRASPVIGTKVGGHVVVIDGKGCLEAVGEAAIGIVDGKKPLAKDAAVICDCAIMFAAQDYFDIVQHEVSAS